MQKHVRISILLMLVTSRMFLSIFAMSSKHWLRITRNELKLSYYLLSDVHNSQNWCENTMVFSSLFLFNYKNYIITEIEQNYNNT